MIKSPRLLFYIGFLLFLLGYFSIFANLGFLGFLQLIGTAISGVSVVLWLMSPNFREKFKRGEREDALTYFWNKIAIRLWSGMFLIFMLGNTLTYFFRMIGD